ncbi:DUF2470 domain-containing protein [Streptomyces sp. NPDC059352]|uniref:DUF2470 domain-containing protein n=1 Tax=Streptomyces sp. NPDC059352 TaxID=3346810 RepID=UPI003698AD1B
MPSAAERTRTLVQTTCSAVLLIPGAEGYRPEQLAPEARAVGPDGEIFLLYAADAPPVRAATHAQADELPVVLELTDVAPVSVPHRIRGRAWVSGRLTCLPGVAERGRTMLRLEVGEARVDDLWGMGEIDAEEFSAAAPDPLHAYETELLQHLHAAHGDRLRELTGLLGDHATALAPTRDVAPLALDRFGLRVRFSAGPERCFDARFDFPEPVRDVGGLRRELHRLFEAARG